MVKTRSEVEICLIVQKNKDIKDDPDSEDNNDAEISLTDEMNTRR